MRHWDIYGRLKLRDENRNIGGKGVGSGHLWMIKIEIEKEVKEVKEEDI